MTLSYGSFAADFFDTESIALSSLEEHEEVVASHDVNLRMLQTGKGAFRSVFASRSCGEIELHSGGFNAALTMEMESPADAVMFIFPRSASGRFLANGVDLGDDKLIFVPPGTGMDIVVPALAGSHSVSIHPRRFDELIQRLCPSLGPPECMTVVGSNPVRSRQLHADIITLIGQSGSSVGGEDLSNLLAVLIAALESDAGGEAPDCLLTAGARARVARRVREYIEHHFRCAVHMDEVCLDTGVGVRTLQRAFREYFRVSVTQYLKLVRLDALHRALRASDPSTASVSKLALENGFGHLGRMSVEFRRQFGKSPSKVLSAAASPGLY